MIGMQGNFGQFPMMNMNMNINNMAPIHPMEDLAEQDMATEILNISKIKEGFYIGDKISAITIDVILQFKITHMINATGNQILNQWESIGISYLTLNWSETPNQILFDTKDEIANRIVEFIDGSLIGKGEGVLAHSFKGQNRVCIVVLIYLMKKYKWSLNKSMQLLKSKKQDVDIPIYFFEQLKNFENRLRQRGELTRDIPWEFENLIDPEEKLLRNTYLNGLKFEVNNDDNLNNKKNSRHIMWADNNPYQKSPLEYHNSEKDLFYQKDIRPITVHQSSRPNKGSIKGMKNNLNNNNTNININKNNIGINIQNNMNNLNNMNKFNNNSNNISNNINSSLNMIKSSNNSNNVNEILNMNNINNLESYNNSSLGLNKSSLSNYSCPQPANNWNNNVPNIASIKENKNDRNLINNENYLNLNPNSSNNSVMKNNFMMDNKNINLIASGKLNSNSVNLGNNLNMNMNLNNINNEMNNKITNSLNNINRFSQQQQQLLMNQGKAKKNNNNQINQMNQINVAVSDNFLNNERNNLERDSNIIEGRINKSVNIPNSYFNMNSLNSLNPTNIKNYNMGIRNNNDEEINRNKGLINSNNPMMNNPNNPNNMMFNYGKEPKNLINRPQPPFNNNNNNINMNKINNPAMYSNDNNNRFLNNNNNKSNVSPFRNNNNNNNNLRNNNHKNNISPFRNNNNDNSAGFMNNRPNNVFNNNNNNNSNNNFMKNKNSNTQTDFYNNDNRQFNNNMINYTPITKERSLLENQPNSNNTTSNKNKNIFQQPNQVQNNYNPVSRFNNGRPMSGGNGINNFNSNIRNQNKNPYGINNNFVSNKPLNNFNPNLIKKGGSNHIQQQNGPSLINRNKNGGPIKIKNNNYINNLGKKPNTPDLNHYNSTATNFMDNNHNRFKYNTNNNQNNNNKKDIKNNTMSNGFGYTGANNYNRKMGGIQRPSTAPQKDKNAANLNNNKVNINRSNQFSNNNMAKPVRYNQRPSSAGGKNKNEYGYMNNNINRNGISKNLSNANMNKNKKTNMGIGINKRLASPQIYSNSNNMGMGFNNNNHNNNIRAKYNPAKHRIPSPVIKSGTHGKRPPLPNSGARIRNNKPDKYN